MQAHKSHVQSSAKLGTASNYMHAKEIQSRSIMLSDEVLDAHKAYQANTMGKKKTSLKSLSNFQSTAQPLPSNRTVKQQPVEKAPTVSKPGHRP